MHFHIYAFIVWLPCSSHTVFWVFCFSARESVKMLVFPHPGVNPCREVGCRAGQACIVNKYGVATCQCPHYCAPVVTPVCGSDGVTYESRCFLEKEACEMQRPISVAFVGSCGKLVYISTTPSLAVTLFFFSLREEKCASVGD